MIKLGKVQKPHPITINDILNNATPFIDNRDERKNFDLLITYILSTGVLFHFDYWPFRSDFRALA